MLFDKRIEDNLKKGAPKMHSTHEDAYETRDTFHFSDNYTQTSTLRLSRDQTESNKLHSTLEREKLWDIRATSLRLRQGVHGMSQWK